MKSPFPGMDPSLEMRWGDVRSRLIIYASDIISRSGGQVITVIEFISASNKQPFRSRPATVLR